MGNHIWMKNREKDIDGYLLNWDGWIVGPGFVNFFWNPQEQNQK